MTIKRNFYAIAAILVFASCKQEKPEAFQLSIPEQPSYGAEMPGLDSAVYYNKVLGALVGSAIGDAMGTSTEMWSRTDIRRKYGYLNTLSPAIRPKSPEGTWNNNLPAGSGTDDTRWKAFTANYLKQFRWDLSPQNFTQSILSYYENAARDLSDQAVKRYPDALDSTLQRVDWIREWARVSRAYQEGPEAYEMARDRFYGGEMSCAGMLYTPMFGLITPNPESAYTTAYQHALFDIGYARDISGLVAALTQMALHTQDSDSLLNTAVFTDPYQYQDSRLVGRIALQQFESARDYVRKARLESAETLRNKVNLDAQKVPKDYPYSEMEWLQQEYVYQQLEQDQKAIPFHAGEIWEILVAGLEFGQGDFLKSIAFIVNYGRDNDTVAAVAGMILGAQVGFDALPEKEREMVLQISKNLMGIDLEAVARQVVAAGN